MTRPYVVAVVVAAVAIGGLLAVALGGGRTTAPLGSPGASGATGSPIAVEPAACPLPGEPTASPTDAPSPSRAAFDDDGTMALALFEGGGADPNEGSGRLRLCIDGVDPIDVDMGCTWSVDRSAVERIGGAVDRPGGGQAFVVLELAGSGSGELAVGLSSTADPIGQYRSADAGRIRVDAAGGAAAGIVAFTDMPFEVTVAGVSVPVDQPPMIGGALRWSCGQAPAPLPGLAVGHLTINLDRPAGRQVEAVATCHWSAGAIGPSVTSVDMAPPPVQIGGGKTWSLRIAQLGDLPLPADPELSIYLSTPAGGDSYQAASYGAVITAEISPASRRGRLRFQGLVLDPETRIATFDGSEATRTLSGIASWTCDDPLGGPEPLPAGVPPLVRPLTRPGTATLAMDGVLDAPIEVPVRCRVHDNPADVSGLGIDGADGRFSIGDETVRLIVDDGSLVLFRTGPDGRILGEYVGGDTGPYLGAVDDIPSAQRLTLRFRPVDPAYSPIGGDGGPREIETTLTLDCRDHL